MAKKNVKNSDVAANVANTEVEGLESAAVASDNLDYSNKEYLENNAPTFAEELVSKKYDAEREPKVQEGLKHIAELMGDKINPLILLLAKWWEVKPARAYIKTLIDVEARQNNQPEDVYLQVVLRENVDKLSTIQQACDRMRYSITYFKPRAGVSSKEVFKVMTINGTMYNVSLNKLEEAKKQFGDDREALKAHIVEISTKVLVDEIL